MTFWAARSLTVRTTVFFAVIACTVIAALGAYFYHSERIALEHRADIALMSRAEHFSRLARQMYTVNELKARPLLFESMLGAEQDVLIFRQPGEPPFIDVNPDHVPVPDLGDSRAREPSHAGITETTLPNGVRVHWTYATTIAREDGEPLIIIAGHPMTSELHILAEYRVRIIMATLAGVLAATLLAYGVLRRGFRPVREIAMRAAQISPTSLSVRLDSRKAPAELRQLTDAFNAMLDRLAEGYQRLSQFSADLAHEIRTPVNVLIGQTQVTLAQTRDVDEYQQTLESNLEELNRLSHLVENMLFLAHADHAALAIEREPVTLADELNKIAEYFEGIADERGMRFAVDARGALWANPMLCRRAINNLVVNAVRYGANDSIVRLKGDEDQRGSTVVVENDGEIQSDLMARLFDRFYRADAARSSFTESSGLGLAIVKAIMNLHGGTASVSCPAPRVVRFELYFPRA
ncbi:heavy metal sensor histidine kinase [Paraburkholderia rhizosphaerae]|uniref:Sensor protein n=1 Tax=Paraburkholderia rhizosphaerae TaxID=480658 RepID=A0A4R8LHA1_9BURK|nr:heavy metal sensor histidine kinase [Paraburkholderia rhizosphaerae]TDY42561.1 two-component system heavy metal sensor histidine kinase CusS [Paraburkholderia rhizosphaerae]